jgi:phenylalanyl-tRNA synthetase beta chain
MQGNVRLFEIGAVFEPTAHELPIERLHAAALVMGDRRPAHFTEPRPPAFDVWDAKELGETLAAAAFAGQAVELQPASDELVLWTIAAGGRVVGAVRRVPLDAPVWAGPAFGVELTLDVVESALVAPAGANAHAAGTGAAPMRPAHIRHRALPTTPAVEFDLALIVPDAVPAAEVERVLRRAGGELLERVTLFDEFRGGDVPADARSLAWRVVLRDPVRTLRDKEVEGRRRKLLEALDAELGVRQRSV